jgi:hypothetical protein
LEGILLRIIEALPHDKLEGTKNIHVTPDVFQLPFIIQLIINHLTTQATTIE